MTTVDHDPYVQGGERTPPQDLAAEQSVLGSMLLSSTAIAEVVEVLNGSDFYRPAHELLYDAIIAMFAAEEPVDAVTLAGELSKQGTLAKVGGPAYLHTLISEVPTAANAAFYAGIVRGQAVRRRIVAAGTRIAQIGYSDGEPDDLTDAAAAELLEVTSGRARQDWAFIGESLTETFDEIEAAGNRGDELTGVPTGFTDLDRLTRGLHPGQFIIVAARPAVGKSTLALDMARAAAIYYDMPTVIFSMEMSRSEIVMRTLSAEARVPLQAIRSGMMREEDWTRLARTMGQIMDAPLIIDDSANMTPVEISAKCRQIQQKHGLRLVIVDYLQLMSSGKRTESRQQEVSEFSRTLKLLAKKLGVPIVALSQLNRGPEQRTDKKPLMSDLRESGSLEQDADIVILLHREDMYEKESPRAGEADFIIAKHRNGPTETIAVAFQGHYARFVDMAR